MSALLWRIGTDTADYMAHDMTGKGAALAGGRWNRIGSPVVYAASNVSLAALETLVHFNALGLPLNRVLVRIEVPDEVWNARQILSHGAAPVGWDVLPAGQVSLDLGEHWLRHGGSALLEVPSAIVPEESNVLINPRHADAAKLQVMRMRRFGYDLRLQPVPAIRPRRRP